MMQSHVCHVDVLMGGKDTGLERTLCAAQTKARRRCSHMWAMAALGAEMTTDCFSFDFSVFLLYSNRGFLNLFIAVKSIMSKLCRSWGDDSVGKVLATQGKGIDQRSNHQNPQKSWVGMAACL